MSIFALPHRDIYVPTYVYTLLQGTPFKQVSGEVQNMLQDLQLADKRGTAARHLSGGMKRKLRSYTVGEYSLCSLKLHILMKLVQ